MATIKAEKRNYQTGNAPSRSRLLPYITGALFTLILLCIMAPAATAHPPSEVLLAYDEADSTLSVTISHRVGNPSNHYIDEVTVLRNGQAIDVRRYENQPGEATFTYSYAIEAHSGDELAVNVNCNRFGSKKSSIIIP